MHLESMHIKSIFLLTANASNNQNKRICDLKVVLDGRELKMIGANRSVFQLKSISASPCLI